MSDTDDKISDGKRGGKTISLRRSSTEQGQVRQSFSHGRSKPVLVEKKRSKRTVTVKDDKPAASGAAPKPATESRGRAEEAAPRRRSGGKGGNRGQMLPTLSEEEHARRVKALEAAKRAQEAARAKAAEDARIRAAEEAERQKALAAEAEAARLAEEEAARARAAEEAERLTQDEIAQAKAAEEARVAAEAAAAEKAEAEARAAAKAAEEAAQAAAAEQPATRDDREGPGRVGLSNAEVAAMTTSLPGPKILKRAPPPPAAPPPAAREEKAAPAARRTVQDDGDKSRPAPRFTKPDAKPARADDRERQTPNRANRGGEKRRSGKLTITQATSGDEMGRQRSLAAMRRRQERDKRKQKSSGPAAKVHRDVQLPDAITVQELANRMSERGVDVIKQLMAMGMMVTVNQSIDAETAQLVIEEMGHRFTRVSDAAVEEGLTGDDDDEADLLPRAPVVTVMGHVDHGKTSLLDALRSANVVSGEAGGITQHIGAYQVETGGGKVTFLDTPGHAAFTSMRARGAQVTDLVILVVAADDSVMPQTVEAITHAKAANVPMIVAINKMDRPAADADRVRQELLRHEVVVEEMGGDVLTVEVSALKRQGLDKLVESIVLQAEILDLKANPDRAAEGAVVEAQLDVGRGAVATVLVQRGTLRVGDVFVVGEQWGKVRALINDHGERVDEAGPSVPVEVLGLSGTPEAGDTLVVVENETRAREIADYRQRKGREAQAARGARGSLDQLLAQAKEAENVSELPILVKADVQGSAEAIAQALEKIGNDEVKVRLLSTGVGAITESDITLAEASGAPVIGFNVRANAPAREAANQKGVEIRYYSVIYDLVDDVRAAASGLLSPEIKETFIGYAEILEVFKISNVGNVAGCRVTEGVARRSAGVRLLRDNVVVHEGKLKTLKRFKDEVKEVQSGQECGMAFERYEDMRKGDVIEIYETQEVERTL